MTIPDQAAPGSVLGWCKEAVQEGQAFNKSQRGYSKIADCIDAIMGDKADFRSTTLSSTTANHFAKTAEDLTAYLTDIRPFWEYTTRNKRYAQNAENYGKLSLHWWLCGGAAHKGADIAFTDVIKYGLTGTGWAHQTYSDRWGDILLESEDPRDVLPIRPSSYDTIQDALGVAVRRERTVNYVRGLKMFEGKENLIQATRDGAVRDSMENTRAGKLMEWLGSPFRDRLFSNRAAREIHRIPTLDLNTLYVDDRTRWEGSTTRYMGEWHTSPQADCKECEAKGKHPLTNWSYKVEKGELLYPNKRMIVFTDSLVGYDGPSPYWHGMFPLSKLTLIPYPWSWLGKGALWDLLPLQRALDKLLRVCDDHFEKIARPDVIADKNSISDAFLKRIDTRKAGGKFRINALAGKGFDIKYPNPLPAEVTQAIQFYINEMSTLSGVQDMSSLMKLKQLPEADTVEAIMNSMTGATRLRSRVIESFMREFAHMLAFNFTQFYTLPMRLAILGESGMTFEDFDFDPGSILPDFVHSSDIDPLTGAPTTEAALRGPRPRADRAKEFIQNFSYNISSSSLLASSEVTNQMKYLQLARAGWMDIWTLFDILDIPNGGEPPVGAKTIPERLKAQNDMGLGMNVNPAGRKASGQAPPRAVVKES